MNPSSITPPIIANMTKIDEPDFFFGGA